jgi:putative FmdB family regulatory protein
MPIYEFRCDKCDAVKELLASVTQNAQVTCDNCQVAMWRIWRPTPTIFKGDGWASKS